MNDDRQDRQLLVDLKKHFPLRKEDFILGSLLGVGSTSNVRIVTHRETQTVWALKEMSKPNIFRRKIVHHVLNERTILERLKHPLVASLAGTFTNEKSLFIGTNHAYLDHMLVE